MQWLRKVFGPGLRHTAAVRPGLYHVPREADGATVRFHLRVDAAGDGLLVANGAALARLTASGVLIAKGLLDGVTTADIIDGVKRRFRGATAAEITRDIEVVQSLIAQMQSPSGGYPILNWADPAFSPKVRPLERPLSADVPLCAPFHSARIVDRLWQLGIPHVTFVVGPDCNESHLIRAVERAGDTGLITGVRGRAAELAAGTRIADMAAAGLDHLDVSCFSADEKVHDALAGVGDAKLAIRALSEAQGSEICPVAQLVLVRPTLPTVGRTLQALVEYGIENVAVFAVATTEAAEGAAGALLAHELPPIARLIEESAERLGLRLLWYPTVRFDPSRSLGEQACHGPRCGGDASIRVQPDGTVFLPRGPHVSAGNLLEDDWSAIERSEACRRYRARIASDTHCSDCPGLVVCAADCPREPAGWADAETRP